MNQTILLLNGPNLNLLGTREPGTYGTDTLESIEERVRNIVEPGGFALRCFQSNAEGALIDWIHANRDAGFLLVNPAAFTHTMTAAATIRTCTAACPERKQPTWPMKPVGLYSKNRG